MRNILLRAMAAILTLTGAAASAQSVLGHVDQVVFESGGWKVKGWACIFGSTTPANVRLYVNGQPQGSPAATSQYAEPDIISACGVSSSAPALPARFALPFSGYVSGQTVGVKAVGPGGSEVQLNGYGDFGLPSASHVESVLASANRILLITAHEDDEIVFSPTLGRFCWNKTCKVIAATSDRTFHPDPQEFLNAMPKIPAQWDLGAFTASSSHRTQNQIIAAWNNEAAGFGFGSLNNLIRLKIDEFRPDVILTFDPRHGTTCHDDHRAVGRAVIDGVNAYYGPNFPDKTKLFLLTTRLLVGFNEFGQRYVGLIPAAPKDRTSAVYSAFDPMLPFWKTGRAFIRELMETYPTQFVDPPPSAVYNAPSLELTTAYQRITDYSSSDTRYISPDDTRLLPRVCAD